jgi:hypothetical protein
MRLLAACNTIACKRARGMGNQVSEQARELLSSRAAVSFETAKFMLDLNKVLKGPLPGYSRYSIPQCVDARRLGVLWVPEALVGLSQIRVAARVSHRIRWTSPVPVLSDVAGVSPVPGRRGAGEGGVVWLCESFAFDCRTRRAHALDQKRMKSAYDAALAAALPPPHSASFGERWARLAWRTRSRSKRSARACPRPRLPSAAGAALACMPPARSLPASLPALPRLASPRLASPRLALPCPVLPRLASLASLWTASAPETLNPKP